MWRRGYKPYRSKTSGVIKLRPGRKIKGKTKHFAALRVNWPDPNSLRKVRIVSNMEDLEKCYKAMKTELVFRLAQQHHKLSEQEFCRRLRRLDQWYEYKIYVRSLDMTAQRLG